MMGLFKPKETKKQDAKETNPHKEEANVPKENLSEKEEVDVKQETKPQSQTIFSIPKEKKRKERKIGQQTETEKVTVISEEELALDGYQTYPTYSYWKKPVNKKLTILLIENTTQVEKQAIIIEKIVKSVITEGLVCILSYGSSVKKSEIFDAKEIKDKVIFFKEDIGEKACLYDALIEASILILEKWDKVENTETEKVKINCIDVIGIGTCKDNGSKNSKDTGIGCFGNTITKSKCMTKYFCLTEENFLTAAEIGFRSIGSISRQY